MKKISVVVPCHNVSHCLKVCVEHLLHQTIGIDHMEIILVDDASTDDGATWRLISEYEQRFPEAVIAVALEQNLRQGGARNVGVSYAGGEYLMFCDADDWLLEETLEHCCDVAQKYNVDVVEFTRRNTASYDTAVSLEKGDQDELVELDTDEKRRKFLFLERGDYGSQNKLYRMSLIKENHIRFAEHLIFEEVSFVVPVRLYEKRHYFLDENLYVYYLSQESTLRSRWEKDHTWDHLQVWMILINDLFNRGLLKEYYSELEYLFFRYAFGLSLKMLFQVNYYPSKEEWKALADTTLRLFPDIQQNKYIDQENYTSVEQNWNYLLREMLDMVFTDESVQAINTMMKKCIDFLK